LEATTIGEASADLPTDNMTTINAAVAAKPVRILLGIEVPHRVTYELIE
jgi:hypothetical protein